jgi:hypothetical protein
LGLIIGDWLLSVILLAAMWPRPGVHLRAGSAWWPTTA